jgi:hypothetical protein
MAQARAVLAAMPAHPDVRVQAGAAAALRWFILELLPYLPLPVAVAEVAAETQAPAPMAAAVIRTAM